MWGVVALRLCLPFSFESVFSLIPTTKTIPTNITKLGDYCFANCEYLTEIKGLENVKEFGKGCFYNCLRIHSLVSISIPATQYPPCLYDLVKMHICFFICRPSIKYGL